MKIGTRMPPFSSQIGFDAYAAWLAENGFGAIDTPLLTRQIARTCERLGLAIGSSDGGGQEFSFQKNRTILKMFTQYFCFILVKNSEFFCDEHIKQ